MVKAENGPGDQMGVRQLAERYPEHVKKTNCRVCVQYENEPARIAFCVPPIACPPIWTRQALIITCCTAQGPSSSPIPSFNEFHYSFLIYILLQNKDSQIIN